MSNGERPQLLLLQKLFPNGSEDVLTMAERLAKEGITDIGLSRMDLITRKKGPQDFVIARLGTYYLHPDRRIIEDPVSEGEIWDFLHETDRPLSRYLPFGKLNLGNIPTGGLIPGKISPFDLLHFPVERFREAIFFVSQRTAFAVKDGVDLVLPHGETSFEIVPARVIVDRLREQLTGWKFKVMDYSGWMKPEQFSPYV